MIGVGAGPRGRAAGCSRSALCWCSCWQALPCGASPWAASRRRCPGSSFRPSAVEELIASWGMWAVAGSIMLMVLHSFVPFPAELVAIANGMLFGPVWGTLITWTGAMLGAYLAFGLARWLGRPFVGQMVGRDIRTQSTAGRGARAAAPFSSAGSSR